MLTHALQEGFLALKELECLDKAMKILDDFPEVKFGEKKLLASANMFTRAFAAIFPELTVKDGWFQRKEVEHSWLVTLNGNILDLYPLGHSGPMLIWNGPQSPWRPLYVETQIQAVQAREFLRNAEYVKRMVKRKAELLKFIDAAE